MTSAMFNKTDAEGVIAEARTDWPERMFEGNLINSLADQLVLALAEVERLGNVIEEIADLHTVEKRYQYDIDQETSHDTPEEAAEEGGIPIDDVTYFEVCAECGRIEMVGEDDWDQRYFKESLWPCATATRILALSSAEQESPSHE